MYAVITSDPPQCNIHLAASQGRSLGARRSPVTTSYAGPGTASHAHTPHAESTAAPAGATGHNPGSDEEVQAETETEPFLRIVPGSLSAAREENKRKPGRPPGSKNRPRKSETKTAPDLTQLSDKTLAKLARDGPQDDVLEKLREMVPQALARLRAIITDDTGLIKPETQMRAAEAVLDRFAAKRVQTEVKTVAGERQLDAELAPLVAEIRKREAG